MGAHSSWMLLTMAITSGVVGRGRLLSWWGSSGGSVLHDSEWDVAMQVAMDRTSASREFSISSSVFCIAAGSLSIFRSLPWDRRVSC